MEFWRLTEKGLSLCIRVQPNAKKEGFAGIWNNTRLKIALKAPAVDGKANEALIDFISDFFHLKKSSIFIMTGQTSRSKIVTINETKEVCLCLIHKLLTENKLPENVGKKSKN